MSPKVVPLDETLEEKFWSHAEKDPPAYHFFRYDWKMQRADTEILLAMEGEEITGAMLVYSRSIVQLRGSRDAVEELLKHLDLEKAEITAPRDCEDLILQRYRAPKTYEIIPMHMEKGQEKIIYEHKPVRLYMKNAEDVSKIVREANPEWWDSLMVEKIRKSLKESYWLGVVLDDRLVSVGNTRLLDFGSNVGIVATDKNYRNRGCATSVVSGLVKKIMQKSPRATIHVLTTNFPAIRVYRKIGFRPHEAYFLARQAEKI